MNGNPLEALYNNVGADFDLGTYEEFAAKMQDSDNIAAFYNNVGADFDLGTYESFTSKIQTGYKPPEREIDVNSQGEKIEVDELEEKKTDSSLEAIGMGLTQTIGYDVPSSYLNERVAELRTRDNSLKLLENAKKEVRLGSSSKGFGLGGDISNISNIIQEVDEDNPLRGKVDNINVESAERLKFAIDNTVRDRVVVEEEIATLNTIIKNGGYVSLGKGKSINIGTEKATKELAIANTKLNEIKGVEGKQNDAWNSYMSPILTHSAKEATRLAEAADELQSEGQRLFGDKLKLDTGDIDTFGDFVDYFLAHSGKSLGYLPLTIITAGTGMVDIEQGSIEGELLKGLALKHNITVEEVLKRGLDQQGAEIAIEEGIKAGSLEVVGEVVTLLLPWAKFGIKAMTSMPKSGFTRLLVKSADVVGKQVLAQSTEAATEYQQTKIEVSAKLEAMGYTDHQINEMITWEDDLKQATLGGFAGSGGTAAMSSAAKVVNDWENAIDLKRLGFNKDEIYKMSTKEQELIITKADEKGKVTGDINLEMPSASEKLKAGLGITDKKVDRVLEKMGLIDPNTDEFIDVEEAKAEKTTTKVDTEVAAEVKAKIETEKAEVLLEEVLKVEESEILEGDNKETQEVVNELDEIANQINNATTISKPTKTKAEGATKAIEVADDTKQSKEAKVTATKETKQDKAPLVKEVKVEKTTKAKKEESIVQEPTKITTTKPVTQEEKVSVVEKKKEEDINEKEAEANYNKISYQNKAHKIDVGEQSRQIKINRLTKLKEEATSKKAIDAIPAIEKRINSLQESLDATTEATELKRVKEARKEVAKEVKPTPTHKEGVYKGENESGNNIFINKKGKRFIVVEGKKVTPILERNKYTKDELDVRGEVRSANNKKVTAFKSKMLGVWQKIHGYKAKIKSTKDQVTRGNFQAALLEAEKEGEKLTNELNAWRKSPKTRDGFEGVMVFNDTKKVDDAIEWAKKEGRLKPTKGLPKAKAEGKVKDTLTAKERSPMMESERVRIENEKIVKAEKEAQAEIDKLESQITSDSDFIIDDDTWDVDFMRTDSERVEDFVYDSTGEEITVKGAKKVANPEAIWDTWKKDYGFEEVKVKHPMQEISIELLNKVNAIRSENKMSEIQFFIADEIRHEEGTSSGIHFLHSREKSGAQYVVISTEGFKRGETPAHELMHAWHAIQRNTLIDINGKEFLYGAKFEAELTNLRETTFNEINKLKELYEKGDLNKTQSDLMFAIDMKWGLDNISKVINNNQEFLAYGMTDVTIAKLLNTISINKKGTKEGRTLFGKLIEAVLGIADALGIKLNKDSILANLLDAVEKADSKYKYSNIKVEMVIPDSKIERLEHSETPKLTRYEIIAKAVSERATTKKEARAVIKYINNKLEKGKKIKKEERAKLLKMVTEGTEKKAHGESVANLLKAVDIKRFKSKASGIKNAKGITIHEDAIDVLATIRGNIKRALGGEDINQVLAEAQERVNSLTEKQLGLKGNRAVILNNIENAELVTLKSNFVNVMSSQEINSLISNVDSIVKWGKVARKEKLELRKSFIDKIKNKGAEALGYEYSKIPNKESKEWAEFKGGKKSTLTTVKEVVNKSMNSLESFLTLMDKLDINEKGVQFKKGTHSRLFGRKAREASIKRDAVQGKHNDIVRNIVLDIFIKPELTPKQLASQEKREEVKSKIASPKVITLLNNFNTFINDKNINIKYTKEVKNKNDTKTTRTPAELYNKSMEQVLQIWMWMQQPAADTKFNANGYGENFRTEINKIIDANPKIKLLGERLLADVYTELGDELNVEYRKRAGISLPRFENYSPFRLLPLESKQEKEGAELHKNHAVASVLETMLLERNSNTGKLNFDVGALSNLATHINNASHFIAYDNTVHEMRSYFGDETIRTAVQLKHGRHMLDVIDMYIDKFASENVVADLNRGFIAEFKGAVSSVFLGLNPTLYFKQRTSEIGFATQMVEGGKDNWLKLRLAALVPNSKEAKEKAEIINRIRNNPTLVKRVKKGSRTIEQENIMGRYTSFFGENIVGNDLKGLWARLGSLTMKMVSSGDMGAITEGGWAVYKSHRDLLTSNGMSKEAANKQAMIEFLDAALEAQQSVAIEDLSPTQLKEGALPKLMTTFKTAQMQLLRNSVSTARSMSRQKVGSKGWRRDAAKMMMFSIGMGMSFAAASQAFRFMWADDEEERERLLARLLYAPFDTMLSGAYVGGDMVNALIKQVVFDESFGYQNLLNTLYDILSRSTSAMVAMGEDKELTKSQQKALEDLASLIVRFPINNTREIVEGAANASNDDLGALKMLGWSDYALGVKKSSSKGTNNINKKVTPRRRVLNRGVSRRR